MTEDPFTPVPLVPDRRLMGATSDRPIDRSRKPDADPTDGVCLICGDPAARWFSGNRTCQRCYVWLTRLHAHGVPRIFATLRDLLGIPEPVRAEKPPKPPKEPKPPKPKIAKPRKAPRPAPPKREAASPLAAAVPVAPPPPVERSSPPVLSLKERLKARRTAGT